MKAKLIAVVMVTIMALPSCLMARPKIGDWWKPGKWFGKKARSTTITGRIDSVADSAVTFKTLDGQILNLIGDMAPTVAENRSVKIRVFGNVVKPDQKFPAGAIQVRNFKVLEELPVIVAEPEPEPDPEPYYEPEPYVEPEPVQEAPAPEPTALVAIDDYDEDDDAHLVDMGADHEEEAVEEKTYVVESGDTLGKISSKMYGTTAKWKKIAEHNGITNPKLLKVGMTLRIP